MTDFNFENLLKRLTNINPFAEPEALMEAIREYLKPKNKPAPRAHLFTINGLTYPLHRDFCFASVPDPHEIIFDRKRRKYRINIQRSKRRYSMLAYLYGVRPGDLIFFFQADPQWPRDILNRRGFRGIWIVTSQPFRDTTSLKHPITGYEILGKCPNCNVPFNFGQGKMQNGKNCPLCGNPYGSVYVKTDSGFKAYSRVVLSARILIKPLIVFSKTAGDNRVYSDMSMSPFIWISRTDNAMGAGKGSSIRVLLPEEAAKIAYMLATEDTQSLCDIGGCKYPGKVGNPITDHNNIPAFYARVRLKRGAWELEHEFHLNLHFSLYIDNQGYKIHKMLGVPLTKLEYWTSELPWGYTGDTADFVASLWDETKGRFKIYLFEFKKSVIDKKALAETLLYVPWVVQVLTQFRPETTDIEVQPVIVGREINVRRIPQRYNMKLKFMTSEQPKNVKVSSPIIIAYSISSVFKVNDQYYANDIDFDIKYLPTRAILPPPISYTTTEVEKDWVSRQYLKVL
ncbi:MAG: hypothetical protein NDF55_00090 [archaeon GB-1867-005]|nr:hypothetical protein [Candidatus Culexmicrobium cathedralense]